MMYYVTCMKYLLSGLYIEFSERFMVKVDGANDEDDVENDEVSPIELSERSKVVVSGAKKWGTWARLAPVHETP